MKKSRIEQLARQAIELNERLAPILTELMGIVQNHDLLDARRQLRAVELSIHPLESAGVPVPEELLSHRRELNQILKDFQQAEQALNIIKNSFSTVFTVQKRRPQPSKSSGSQSVLNRCTIADLISAGFLKDGMKIVNQDIRHGKTVKGYIRGPGYIELELDGRVERFNSPSSAGTRASGRSTNGWIYWFVHANDGHKVVLDEYRKKFLRRMANE